MTDDRKPEWRGLPLTRTVAALDVMDQLQLLEASSAIVCSYSGGECSWPEHLLER